MLCPDWDGLQPGWALILHCESAEQRKHLHVYLDTHYRHLEHRSVLISCIPPTHADVMLYRNCRCGRKHVRLAYCDEYEGKVNYQWGTCRRCGMDVVESCNEYDRRSRPHNVMMIQRSQHTQPTLSVSAPAPSVGLHFKYLLVQQLPQCKTESKLWWRWLRAQLPDTWVDAKELIRRASFTGLVPPLLNLIALFVGNCEY